MALLASLIVCLFRVPGGTPRIDQWHGMLLASVLVLVTAWEMRRTGWHGVAWWAVPVVFIWPDPYGVAWLWLATWTLVCLAVGQLDATEIRQAILVVGWVQVPFVLLEVAHHPLCETIGGGLAGSLGRRYLLGALWGLCALWSEGLQSWGWALASLCTGSYLGAIPAVGKLLWRSRMRWLLVGAVALPWLLRISWRSRLLAWSAIPWWPPLGFHAFPNGFIGVGMLDQLLQWRDYHSAMLELWVRFGPWALVLMAGIAMWVRRLDRWLVGWLALLAGFQSVEAYPAAAWLLAMAIQGGRHVDSVSETARAS